MIPDLSQSPDALFDTKLTWQDFVLEGVRLGDNTNAIPLLKIKDTTMEAVPVGVTCLTYQDGKTYFELSGIKHEYLLADRIKSAYEHNGWVHLTGGAKFRILNKQVVELRLDEELLSTIRTIPFSQIEKLFGRPDRKVVWEEPVDALYTTTTFIYASRQLRITYEDWDNTINGVNIGATLIEEHQSAMSVSSNSRTANRSNDRVPSRNSAWWRTLFNPR
jgi:hypothetical protein